MPRRKKQDIDPRVLDGDHGSDLDSGAGAKDETPSSSAPVRATGEEQELSQTAESDRPEGHHDIPGGTPPQHDSAEHTAQGPSEASRAEQERRNDEDGS